MRLITLLGRVGRTLAGAPGVRDERGIALVMALGIVLVLTIALTTVITLTAASARDSHRVNAGQKATALAEAGLNNAVAVLTAHYPGTVTYPGDGTLLTPPRVNSYPSGSVRWSGTIEPAPSAAPWNDEWRITSIGTVTNPTGPGSAPVTRTMRAIVPIVLPEVIEVDPGSSSLNWVYANQDIRFAQSVIVRSPVYAKRDLRIEGTAKIAETIPANASGPERPNKVAVGRNLSLRNPQNKIGNVFGTAFTANYLGEVFVQGTCSKQLRLPPPDCGWGAVDDVWAANPLPRKPIPTGYVIEPKLTCCSPISGPIPGIPEESPTSTDASVMGFWYRNAAVGPYSICETVSGTPPRFDKPTGVDGPDDLINQSATAGRPAFDITGPASYTCSTGRGELSWNASTTASPTGLGARTLKINGAIFIDGSAKATATDAKYVGRGALILSGTFLMQNHHKICVGLTPGGDCDVNVDWNPNTAGMFIFSSGDFALDLSTNAGAPGALPGQAILIRAGQFQGGLFAAKDIDAVVSGTLVQGPMISAYGNVAAGQSGELSFPAISFPTSGSGGFAGPLPLPKLLAPRQFVGG